MLSFMYMWVPCFLQSKLLIRWALKDDLVCNLRIDGEYHQIKSMVLRVLVK